MANDGKIERGKQPNNRTSVTEAYLVISEQLPTLTCNLPVERYDDIQPRSRALVHERDQTARHELYHADPEMFIFHRVQPDGRRA